LELREGKIEPVEKVRTKQKAIRFTVELIVERLKGKSSIRLAATHANDEAEASAMLEAASAQLHPVETFCCPLSPVIGTHTGPGTVALNYMSGIS
jgi:fatty acid-binding protein DegV